MRRGAFERSRSAFTVGRSAERTVIDAVSAAAALFRRPSATTGFTGAATSRFAPVGDFVGDIDALALPAVCDANAPLGRVVTTGPDVFGAGSGGAAGVVANFGMLVSAATPNDEAADETDAADRRDGMMSFAPIRSAVSPEMAIPLRRATTRHWCPSP